MRTFLALTVLAAAAVAGPSLSAQTGPIPAGFTSIFNGSDLAGWHISGTNHHGNTREWKVSGGVLTGRQEPAGNGGILLTDKRYKDFEVYLEVKPDFGCDSGLFLRSNEAGQAYQVMLDYLEKGNVGGIYGERLEDVKAVPSQGWEKVWKKDDWNALRARIEGSAPHIQVWLNGTKITDFQDNANHAAGGAEDGMIAVQVHGGQRWVEGGYHRFRNIAVKELN
jgi:3-keto-disaccharide hydrolase